MFGREFQVVGAVQRKARPENTVLWNGTDSSGSGTVEERKVRPQTRAVMRRLRYTFSGVSVQRNTRNARKKVRNERIERNSRKNRKLQPIGTDSELSSFQLNSSF